MQVLIDTATDTLADLRSAIVVVEMAIDERRANTPASIVELDPLAPTFDAAEAFDPSVFKNDSWVATSLVPPVPTVPAAAVTATAVAPAALAAEAAPPAVDSTGLEWDSRIHSETRALNKDGTWRTRRKLAAGVLETVTAELRGTMPVPVPPAALVPPPPAAAPVPPPPVVLPAVDAAPAAPVPPAPVHAGAESVPMTFGVLMRKITAALSSGKFKQPQVVEVCKQHGVDSLQALAQQPAIIPSVAATIDRLIGA